MAAEPLGSEAVSAIYRADQMYGPGGMPYARLRKFLQSHLQQMTFVQRKQLVEHPPVAKGYGRAAGSQERERRSPLVTNTTQNPPRRPLQAHAYEANTNDAVRRITYATTDKAQVVRKYGRGPNPCWVCGTDQYIWYHCDRKKKGRCAVCGSEGHLTRVCAQRYQPHPSHARGGEQLSNPANKASCELTSASPNKEDEHHLEPLEQQDTEECQPHDEVELACASVQLDNVHLPPAMSPFASPIDITSSCMRDPPYPLVLPQQPVLGAMTLIGPAPQLKQSPPISGDILTMARKCMSSWPGSWSSLLCHTTINQTIVVQPVRSPPQSPLLHYPIMVNEQPTTAMLDTGASHSFITRTLVQQLKLSSTRLQVSLTATDFSGSQAVISEMVTAVISLSNTSRQWTLYVCARAPAPVVLGLDVVLKWPLYLNPADRCLHIIPSSGTNDTTPSERECSIAKTIPKELESNSRVISPSLTPAMVSSVQMAFNEEEIEVENGLIDLMYKDLISEDIRYRLNPDSSVLSLLHRASVTASGFEEAERLKQFIDQLSPSFRSLVGEFPQLFQPPDRDPPDRPAKHYIYVAPDVVPAARRAYPLPHSKLEVMRSQMRELIDKGWVVPSSSPWASPILLVPKDQGKSLRLCIDFRDLNALTKKDRFPLPRIDVLLHRASKARIFSKIDLASGFHQIQVYPQHRELTAFILPETVDGHSLWEWKVMPFGLVNAPSTFQRAMSVALRGCEAFTVVYIDDILVFSPNEEEHLEHLHKVFAALQRLSYHVRLEKCSFFATEVPFLGHILTPDGIKADVSRHDTIFAFQMPFTTAKQVRSFLGMVMWFRVFIPNVATLAAPLFPFTSAKKTLQWTDAAEAAVLALKEALSTTPVLARYDRDLDTRVTTDVSITGLGAVLEQQHGEVWRPVGYWSRKLIDAETRYSATDLEWLAVVDSVSRTWRHLLEDIPFTVRSDHAALERKLTKSAHDPPISPRQARWIEKLMPFHITFEYIPGRENTVSDALSRYPALKNFTFTLSLITPQTMGVLGRIAFVARGDPKYQELMLRVLSKMRNAKDNTGSTEDFMTPSSSPEADQQRTNPVCSRRVRRSRDQRRLENGSSSHSPPPKGFRSRKEPRALEQPHMETDSEDTAPRRTHPRGEGNPRRSRQLPNDADVHKQL